MELEATKREYVKLRAEGRSYSYIAKELHISKSTCSSWEQMLKAEVTALKQEQLQELYQAYSMTREARIARLGEMLGRIDDALADANLKELPPEKLLDFKLKYTEALKAEVITPAPPYDFGKIPTDRAIITALQDLLNRIRAGEVTTAQASRESLVLANLLKAFDAAELQRKIDALEVILEGSVV